MPFQHAKLNGSVWLSSLRFRFFLSFDSNFLQWYNRVRTVKVQAWRDTGIDKALEFCYFDWRLHNSLLGAFASFGSPFTNCFFFRSSLISITLLDVFAITGLSPFSEDPSQSNLSECPFAASFKDSSYGPFITQHMKTSGKVSSTEHTAFL